MHYISYAPGTLVQLRYGTFKNAGGYPLTKEVDADEIKTYLWTQLNSQFGEVISTTKDCSVVYLPYLDRYINCFTNRFDLLKE